MKRGVAIGVASCVAILLIALLAFFAIRRRNRILQCPQKSDVNVVELSGIGVWPQEKPLRIATPPPPPVEADARTIYEMDASQIPELPSETDAQEIKKNSQSDRNSWCLDDDATHTQKRQQWHAWSMAPNTPNEPHNQPDANQRLPLLTISAPEVSPGEVSPLLVSPWDTSSSCASPVSALPDAHLPSHRYGQWDR